MICQHKDCQQTDVIECRLHNFDTNEDDVFYYCADHCQQEGFCWYCGQFWAGVEAFDIDNPGGCCPNCIDELRADMGEVEDDAEDWDPGPWAGDY